MLSKNILSFFIRCIMQYTLAVAVNSKDIAVAAVTSPADIQLHITSSKDPSSYIELKNTDTLAAAGFVDQQVLAMTLKTSGKFTWRMYTSYRLRGS